MPEAVFSNEHNQPIVTLHIESQNMNATGGPLFPHLRVQGKAQLNSTKVNAAVEVRKPDGSMVELTERYTLLGFVGAVTFKLGNTSLELARVNSQLAFVAVRRPQAIAYPDFEMPLDAARVRQIESHRTTDVRLELDLLASFARHVPIPDGAPPEYEAGIAGFFTSHQRMELIIAQSDWVSKLLPRLGYNTLSLIEVPAAARITPAAYAKLMTLLTQADSLLLSGDYDAAIARCRKVLELIPAATKARLAPSQPGFRGRFEAFANRELSALLDESQVKSLTDIAAGLYGLGNKAVHSPKQSVYRRADAESILLFTSGLVSYVGRLLDSR